MHQVHSFGFFVFSLLYVYKISKKKKIIYLMITVHLAVL